MPPPTRLPGLSRHGGADDGLSPRQRQLMVIGILAAHVAGIYGLLQVKEVREAVIEAVPMFVDLIAPPTPPAPPVPPPPKPQPQPIQKKAPPPAPIIAAAPSPAPSAFVVPTQPAPEPLPPPAPPQPIEVVAPPAPPAPAPKVIPASEVQYLERPDPVYPRQSIRSREEGRVMVRLLIDESGLPRNVELGKSSGSSRLDEAAVAGVRKFRFKPHMENGQAVSVWAFIPVDFGLEK